MRDGNVNDLGLQINRSGVPEVEIGSAFDLVLTQGKKLILDGTAGGEYLEAGAGLLKLFIGSIEEFRVSASGIGVPTGSLISIDGVATTTSRNNIREKNVDAITFEIGDQDDAFELAVGVTDVTEVNTVIGVRNALALTATDGFLYIPSMAGVPSGTPTAYTGKVALQYDTTNNDLYVYNSGWKAVGLN